MGGIPRADLADTLKPTLPSTWRLIDHVADADNAEQTTLRLTQLTLRRVPQAPRSRAVEVVFEAVLTVAGEDMAGAEDRLDDELLEWLVVVTRLGLTWTDFTKTKTSEGRLGYRGELSTSALNTRED